MPLLYGQTPNRIQVAVINFDVSIIDVSVSTILTDRFRSELMNTGKFDVMERSRMDEILTEQGFQQTGICNSDACVAQAGKILGVRRIIAGSVGRVGKLYSVSARLVDIESGRILINRTEDCDCPIEKVLTQSMRSLAFKMANFSASQISLHPAMQASLIINGTPSGALLFLNNKLIGKVPLINKHISAGKYEIKVKAQGYEDSRQMIELTNAEEKKISIELKPKTKSKAIGKSLICPGLGQNYSGQKTKALLFPILEFTAISAAIWANTNYNKSINDYHISREKYLSTNILTDVFDTRKNMDLRYKDIECAELQRNIAIGIAAGIWIWNIIDSAIWGPKIALLRKGKIGQTKLHFYYSCHTEITLFGFACNF